LYEKYDIVAAYLVAGVVGVSMVFGGVAWVEFAASSDVVGATFGLAGAGAVLTIGGGSLAGMNSGPFWPHAARLSVTGTMTIMVIVAIGDKSKMGFTD
jgi:hypothetical protein